MNDDDNDDDDDDFSSLLNGHSWTYYLVGISKSLIMDHINPCNSILKTLSH